MPPHWRKQYEPSDDEGVPGWLVGVVCVCILVLLLVTLGCTRQPYHAGCTHDYRFAVYDGEKWVECTPKAP